jgi:predicted phage terminase large subunit-like protein
MSSGILRAWREFSSPRPEPYYNGNLRQFSREVFPQFKWFRHVEVLADKLEAVVADELKRLMTFEPPRHGKSLLQSRIFPAYALAKRPDWWLGLCSYEATLAQDFSRTAKDYFARGGGKMRDDSQAVNLWQTEKGGGMWASGVGGPITGRGANVGIIDDPLKNAQEAASETIRKKHKSWYESTFFTRLEPDGAVLITLTRWHEDDLAGWLLEREKDDPERWDIVNLPALRDNERTLFPVTCNVTKDWRRDGQALCPERYDEKKLANIKRKVGARVWDALYQQRPAPDSGTIFKREWWQFYTIKSHPIKGVPFLPDLAYMIQSWDCSFKDTEGTDFVSGQVWGLEGARIYLLDRVNERMSFGATCDAIRTMTGKWPKVLGKYVEEKANGAAVINALHREIMGIVPVQPDGGKIARAYAVQPLVQARNAFLPHPSIAPWVEDFIRQLAGFPNAAHDDDVDACTQALNQLAWSARDEPKAVRPEVSDDQHPGFDYEKRERRPRKATVGGPNVEDDIRANRYQVPRVAGFTPYRMPRFFGDQNFSEEEES